uniref:DNA mismatch endonuclease Vsr n=1 Tax=Candidatus Kentrum sp. SD TaxID=2126332 RepID=A0A450Y8G7_9GAMM|nr:MAG: DNA mismatch endonuclease Vsr [Candidatus Kentron sp. SD]VFK42496.1 MAG: DNA mismatch endonuclease Vsr [Candidatus Kentron sp. SD]
MENPGFFIRGGPNPGGDRFRVWFESECPSIRPARAGRGMGSRRCYDWNHREARSKLTDTLSVEERSKRMSLIRCVGSGPEMKLRRFVHGMGFRYRLHARKLPGKPDLVFPSRRAVIFMAVSGIVTRTASSQDYRNRNWIFGRTSWRRTDSAIC